MPTYLLGTLVKAIGTALFAAASVVRGEQFDTLTEGIHDYPLLQVYPESNTGTSAFSQTDRLSLSGKHSIKEYTIYANLYARQRSHIAEDFTALVTAIDEIEEILDTQGCPPFGRSEITSFQWSWTRVTFDYGGGVEYPGARFTIVVRAGSTR